ncbi:hypothetical protein BCAH1134_C0475 (plasmid) [Bacillus cereus AH1134]|nr:hypothetical protein BCAH1134_C0475 [Bacillus cereus AH1134]
MKGALITCNCLSLKLILGIAPPPFILIRLYNLLSNCNISC